MTNKLLLALFAVGLFANAGAMLVRPVRADALDAQSYGQLLSIASSPSKIESHLYAIASR